jgi:hypothetical protein
MCVACDQVSEIAVKEFQRCVARFTPELARQGARGELDERAQCDYALNTIEIVLYLWVPLGVS